MTSPRYLQSTPIRHGSLLQWASGGLAPVSRFLWSAVVCYFWPACPVYIFLFLEPRCDAFGSIPSNPYPRHHHDHHHQLIPLNRSIRKPFAKVPSTWDKKLKLTQVKTEVVVKQMELTASVQYFGVAPGMFCIKIWETVLDTFLLKWQSTSGRDLLIWPHYVNNGEDSLMLLCHVKSGFQANFRLNLINNNNNRQ